MNGFELRVIGAPLIRAKLEYQVIVVAHSGIGTNIEGE
jgi:hypothetical protein